MPRPQTRPQKTAMLVAQRIASGECRQAERGASVCKACGDDRGIEPAREQQKNVIENRGPGRDASLQMRI